MIVFTDCEKFAKDLSACKRDNREMYLFVQRKTERLSNNCSAVRSCTRMCKAQSAFLRDLHQIVSSWSVPASSTLGYAWTPLTALPHIPVHSALSNIYSWITARCAAPGRGLYFGDALSAHSRPVLSLKELLLSLASFCSCRGNEIHVLCVSVCAAAVVCMYRGSTQVYSVFWRCPAIILFGSMIVMRGNSLMTSGRCDPVAVAQGSASASLCSPVFACECVTGVISRFWWKLLAVNCKTLHLW